jgi:N-acetylglucosaminyldiphosphoundecaprenol N-acetyl-beta-D-mannosaminyltransferase
MVNKMSERNAGYLLDIPIDRCTLEQAIDNSLDVIDQRSGKLIFVCANPHSIVVAQSDSSFATALHNSNLSVADGVGVTMMAKLANVTVGPRIAGHDFFLALLQALEERGSGRVFFFGSSNHVLDLIRDRFARDFPSLVLCGYLSPPYGEWSEQQNDHMIQEINDAKPDVLWVGMTAPKQEKWVEQNKNKLTPPVIGSIGAVFDFYAGTYPRAPKWMCRIGLEWLYRLIKEPKRMWKRNLVSSPKFVLLVLTRHLLSAGKYNP